MDKKLLTGIRRYRLAITWMLRLTFIFLLAASGVGKLLNGRKAGQFLVALTNSHPAMERWADGFIIGLSIFEIILAGSLLHRRSIRIGLSILSGILVLFSGALIAVLVRDVPLRSCGCLGAFGGEMSLEIALLRNLVLLVAALGCYLLLITYVV